MSPSLGRKRLRFCSVSTNTHFKPCASQIVTFNIKLIFFSLPKGQNHFLVSTEGFLCVLSLVPCRAVPQCGKICKVWLKLFPYFRHFSSQEIVEIAEPHIQLPLSQAWEDDNTHGRDWMYRCVSVTLSKRQFCWSWHINKTKSEKKTPRDLFRSTSDCRHYPRKMNN